jgi:transcriptional regulator with XRE-family HTH domain
MEQIFIGKNIQRWRSFKGKKQETLAREIGISRVMLSRNENGRSVISLQQLEIIAALLDLKVEDLIIPPDDQSK